MLPSFEVPEFSDDLQHETTAAHAAANPPMCRAPRRDTSSSVSFTTARALRTWIVQYLVKVERIIVN